MLACFQGGILQTLQMLQPQSKYLPFLWLFVYLHLCAAQPQHQYARTPVAWDPSMLETWNLKAQSGYCNLGAECVQTSLFLAFVSSLHPMHHLQEASSATSSFLSSSLSLSCETLCVSCEAQIKLKMDLE
jgi:hypothetical protein